MALPLRKLYIAIMDIYDENEYPIAFPKFYDVFMKHMKFTRNNIIDSVVLLLYGLEEIDKFGTAEEQISIERIKDYKKKGDETTRISPIFDFFTKPAHVRIGYDYAGIIKNNEEIPIETDENIFKSPDFEIDIDPIEYVLKFYYNEKYFIFNLKTYEFKSYFNISEEQF